MSEQRTDAPPPDRLAALWQRVKEHRIAQWTVGYLAVAYGIQHAVILTSESYEWPNIIARVSMTLLALGLPVAMTLAWYHGMRASRRVSAGELSILSVLLVIASMLFYALVRPPTDIHTVAAPAVQEASVTAARQASLSPSTAISLAVMPFENLSPDPNQGYFADGMGEEITTALAKIPDLRVVGRESAQQFKGKNANFRDIGRALNATHLLEGSVRKAGNQLRISAQLVRADTGVTLWANSYDRQEADVFAIQEDVARAIAASLHMTLPLKPGENLVSNRVSDPETYQLYLRGLAAYRTRTGPYWEMAEQLAAKEPDFAPGWSLLAYGDRGGMVNSLRRGDFRMALSWADKSEAAARKAIELDPRAPSAYAALGNALTTHGKWQQAQDALKQALMLDPNLPETLSNYASFLFTLGYLRQAADVRAKLGGFEPLAPQFNNLRAEELVATGQTDAAIALLQQVHQQGYFNLPSFTNLAAAFAAKGQFADAADILTRSPEVAPRSGQIQAAREELQKAAALLRTAPAKIAPDKLPFFNGELGFVYAYLGAPERIIDYAEKGAAAGIVEPFQNTAWVPAAAEARKTQRFKNLVRKLGLVDYWRQNSWPDLCHPTIGDDFACD